MLAYYPLQLDSIKKIASAARYQKYGFYRALFNFPYWKVQCERNDIFTLFDCLVSGLLLTEDRMEGVHLWWGAVQLKYDLQIIYLSIPKESQTIIKSYIQVHEYQWYFHRQYNKIIIIYLWINLIIARVHVHTYINEVQVE